MERRGAVESSLKKTKVSVDPEAEAHLGHVEVTATAGKLDLKELVFVANNVTIGAHAFKAKLKKNKQRPRKNLG